MKPSAYILRTENARDRFKSAWAEACQYLQHDQAVRVTVEPIEPTRTIEQNAKMWAVLGDVARQVDWHVDGKLQKISAEDWKDILTAGLKKTQRIAAGIEGGFVMLGQRTSRMRIADMSELIEFAVYFGAQHGVVWSNSDEGRIAEARAA